MLGRAQYCVANRLICPDRDGDGGLGEFHLDRAVVNAADRTGGRVGGESLDTQGHLLVGLVAVLFDVPDQRRRSAAVDRGAGVQLGDDRAQVWPASTVGGDDQGPVGVDLAQVIGEGHVASVTAVQGPPVLPGPLQTACHREDRRDADAAGDEQVRLRWHQPEMVTWTDDRQFPAHQSGTVDLVRAAAAGCVVPYGYGVAGLVLVVAAQGVLPDGPGWQDQVDVRARFPMRDCRRGRVDQGQAQHSGCFAANLLDHHRGTDVVCRRLFRHGCYCRLTQVRRGWNRSEEIEVFVVLPVADRGVEPGQLVALDADVVVDELFAERLPEQGVLGES